MFLIDTHTHLYLNAFDPDRKEVVKQAVKQGVKYMLLPNIDGSSIEGMLQLCEEFPSNCFPMMGLHPTSVNETFMEELDSVEHWLKKKKFIAIGETGIDLYWDKTFLEEQKIVFSRQLEMAKKYKVPIVVHMRDSFDETYKVVKKYASPDLTGVFHCFTGNEEQARKIIDLNFKLGIGGVVTFKNSGLADVVKNVDLKHILLETDSPFLAPAPFRGKRNESAYIKLVAQKLAAIKQLTVDEIAEITTANALDLFNFELA
ncbi:MAG: TatD family hydrolase [Bacteroidales bacterium]